MHTSEKFADLSAVVLMIFIHVKTLIMSMLFLEQARGRPGAHGHHVLLDSTD